jgi:hypothetical protein
MKEKKKYNPRPKQGAGQLIFPTSRSLTGQNRRLLIQGTLKEGAWRWN